MLFFLKKLLGATFSLFFITPLLLAGPQDITPFRLIAAAKTQIGKTLYYNPAYKAIPYPNGDLPLSEGVCTDVIIRAYRAQGIDLQKLVHEDMKDNFARYPKNWGASKPDKNIDHRRVPNLMTFFTRHGIKFPLSQKKNPGAFLPGDMVTWDIILASGQHLPHIGFVSDQQDLITKVPLVIHNIGSGTQEENILFAPYVKMTGHFRYTKKSVLPCRAHLK